jgi:hypothetical protein
MKRIRSIAVGALCALGLIFPVQFLGTSAAQAAIFTPLALGHGWSNGPFGTSSAGVTSISGIVHLKGAIRNTTTDPSMVPFTLPAAFRPGTNRFIPVDLCNATNGRLFIQPSGVVTIQAEGGKLSNARCFTSLDGASFAP